MHYVQLVVTLIPIVVSPYSNVRYNRLELISEIESLHYSHSNRNQPLLHGHNDWSFSLSAGSPSSSSSSSSSWTSSSQLHYLKLVAAADSIDSFAVIEFRALQFQNGGSFSLSLLSTRNSDRISRLPSTQMTYAEETYRLFWRMTFRCTFLLMTFVSYVMTLVSIQGFWVKCSSVYGFWLSWTTSRITSLCRTSPCPSLFSDVNRMINYLEKVTLINHMKAAVQFWCSPMF